MTSSNGNIFRVTGQWRGPWMFSLICAWINGSVNNRGDLRRHRIHYDVIVMDKNMCALIELRWISFPNTMCRSLKNKFSVRQKPWYRMFYDILIAVCNALSLLTFCVLHIDYLMQKKRNSSALVRQLSLCYIKASICLCGIFVRITHDWLVSASVPTKQPKNRWIKIVCIEPHCSKSKRNICNNSLNTLLCRKALFL